MSCPSGVTSTLEPAHPFTEDEQDMVNDSISKKDIEAHQRIFDGLTNIKDDYSRHVVAGMVSAPEFDIGV